MPGDHKLTDNAFIPHNEPDPIEDLRRDIRQYLHQGRMPAEIVDALVQRGLEPAYAAEMVHSVRTTGRRLEARTEQWFINGVPIGPSVSEARVILTPRQQRLERAARGEASEPNTDLALEGGPTLAKQLARN
jgi:hypothetical protein